MVFDPSSPLDAIRRRFPGARVDFADGRNPREAARAAAAADAVVVFADQYLTETADAPDLALPHRQDALIESVARANRRTVVVLETGGPVLMPWLDRTAAVIEAWYPGQKGGEAIAEILSGDVNPSGRLPVTFPAQRGPASPSASYRGIRGPLRSVRSDGAAATAGSSPPITRKARTSATSGFFARGERPLFPFGYGLSYTTFGLRDLKASVERRRVAASVKVRNLGSRAGAATAELYLSGPKGGRIPLRLAGWSRIELAPGEEREATVAVDPRLLRRSTRPRAAGESRRASYRLTAGFDAGRRDLTASVSLDSAELPP